MVAYIFPLFSIIFTTLATLACLRFFFSKQFYFWILPLLFSALLAVIAFIYVFFPSLILPYNTQAMAIIIFTIAAAWYAIVICFRFILKKGIGKNKVKYDSYKNFKEAQYLEKIERRKYIKYDKIIRDKEKYGAQKLATSTQQEEWLDLFDNF